jgi:hypothetical protein
MNSDVLAQIFVAIIATLPALIGIFSTFMKPYAQKPFDLSGRSFARVLRIQRSPFDEKEWLLLRKQYIIDIVTPLFVLFFIASITLFVIVVRDISLTLSVISFLVASLYILPFVYSLLRYINLGNNPRESRYLIFKEATIEIQTDYESLFDHMQAVLGYLNAKASEIDFDTKSFSAYVRSKIFYQKINIDIQSQEEQKQLVSISFSSRLRRNYFLRPSFEVGSDIMNHFINLIVVNIEQVERTVQSEKHT